MKKNRTQSNSNVSQQTIDEAMKVAKATQKPQQTQKETKLIAQGIQKGIAEYKKQQKNKSRDLDKQKKKLSQEKAALNKQNVNDHITTEPKCKLQWLPWSLLLVSWLIVLVYVMIK